MAQYLISFPSGAMDHIPEQEMPDVAKAAHAVCEEAIKAGAYVVAGGWSRCLPASWPRRGRSPRARTRTSWAASRSWTRRHARRH
jgi:hypothetical protein